MTVSMFPLDGLPAIRGGRPAFPEGLPIARPSVPDSKDVLQDVERILSSGFLTNGAYVQELEQRAAQYLGVGHCVAVSSCTAGLMLVLRAARLSGDVVLPSFTFGATAHAVSWNGLRPVFADIDPDTLTLSASHAMRASGVRTSAILATHVFGTPCDVEGLATVARQSGSRLFFDAAHAFGSKRRGVPVGGFGDAEVFSLSPTKPVVACEGGIIATNDPALAEGCRIGRDYANPGNYDFEFVGLNARMSEIHAAVAIRSLESLDERLARRGELAARYRAELSRIPGLSFPGVREGDVSTFKDLAMLVGPDQFGLDAPGLCEALAAEGIDTRRYYFPPVHTTRAYRGVARHNGSLPLPVTGEVAPRVVTLPLWSEMEEAQVDRVAEAVDRISRSATGARTQSR